MNSDHSFDRKHVIEFEENGCHLLSLQPFLRFRGLDIPWDDDAELQQQTGYIAKSTRSRKVVRLMAGHFGVPVEVFVKRYNFKTWLKVVLRTLRKSRAREEFELGWQLFESGVRTPRPVWLAEKSGASGFSMLATEALPDAESAIDRWKRCQNESERMDLMQAIGEFTAHLHDHKFFHDDYKSAHLLVLYDRPSIADEFHVIDLLGGEMGKSLTRSQRAQNLHQLVRSFIPPRRDFGFKFAHRLSILQAYCGSTAEAIEWSNEIDKFGGMRKKVH